MENVQTATLDIRWLVTEDVTLPQSATPIKKQLKILIAKIFLMECVSNALQVISFRKIQII